MTDVLVVGGGLAAMAAALEAVEAGASVVLASAGTGSSELAQGGIAAAVGPDDSPELHEADTLAAGAGVCDPAARMLVSEAPQAVAWLEARGVEFDRGPDGRNALALEAAHSRSRVLHAAGDGSGAAIASALRGEVEAACRRGCLHRMDDAWLDGLLRAGDRVTGGRFHSGERLMVTSTDKYACLRARHGELAMQPPRRRGRTCGPASPNCQSRFRGSVTLADHKMDHKPVRARERPSATGGMR